MAVFCRRNGRISIRLFHLSFQSSLLHFLQEMLAMALHGIGETYVFVYGVLDEDFRYCIEGYHRGRIMNTICSRIGMMRFIIESAVSCFRDGKSSTCFLIVLL